VTRAFIEFGINELTANSCLPLLGRVSRMAS